MSEAPGCSGCHGTHAILSASNPASPTHPLNLARTCAACHADPAIVKKYDIPVRDPLGAYQRSVHGIALLSERNLEVATCGSCHGSHEIRTQGDPLSPIHWQRVAETCGRCHDEIYRQYAQSVHGRRVAQGLREAPVCTDCHGEHEVRSPTDPRSPVHPLRVSSEVCGRCHASNLITRRFGIPEARVRTFEASYHGLAIKGGSLAAANCASCHGIHDILPSSDPRSKVNPANLATTCGACHADASANFAKGPVHLTGTTLPGRIVSLVKHVYVALIIVVIGLMLLHNGLDMIRRTRIVLAGRRRAP